MADAVFLSDGRGAARIFSVVVPRLCAFLSAFAFRLDRRVFFSASYSRRFRRPRVVLSSLLRSRFTAGPLVFGGLVFYGAQQSAAVLRGERGLFVLCDKPSDRSYAAGPHLFRPGRTGSGDGRKRRASARIFSERKRWSFLPAGLRTERSSELLQGGARRVVSARPQCRISLRRFRNEKSTETRFDTALPETFSGRAEHSGRRFRPFLRRRSRKVVLFLSRIFVRRTREEERFFRVSEPARLCRIHEGCNRQASCGRRRFRRGASA